MAALIDATTGYSGDVGDWTDTTPGYGIANSLSNVGTYTFVAWTPHALLDGIYVIPDVGGGTSKETWGIVGA